MAFVGIGLTLGSWMSLALSTAPIAALVRRIKVEEKMLVDHLSDDYRCYQQETSRLVPRLW